MGLKTLGALLAAIGLAIIAPFADSIFNASGLQTPFLLAALLPVSYIPEAPAGAALVLTGRYDVRAAYTLLTQLLRAIGLVDRLALRRHRGRDRARDRPDRRLDRGRPGRGRASSAASRPPRPSRSARTAGRSSASSIQSSIGSGVVSLRTAVVPLLLGTVVVAGAGRLLPRRARRRRPG